MFELSATPLGKPPIVCSIFSSFDWIARLDQHLSFGVAEAFRHRGHSSGQFSNLADETLLLHAIQRRMKPV